jgi:hypothetical protein
MELILLQYRLKPTTSAQVCDVLLFLKKDVAINLKIQTQSTKPSHQETQ